MQVITLQNADWPEHCACNVSTCDQVFLFLEDLKHLSSIERERIKDSEGFSQAARQVFCRASMIVDS